VTTIPGLPLEFQTVPPAPSSPDDPEREAKRAAWEFWKHEQIIPYRESIAAACANNPTLQQIEKIKCKRSTPYFLVVYGHLFEPRKRKRKTGLGGEFVLFERQVQLLEAMKACLETEDEGPKSDLVVPKSRDVGASWCMCGQALKEWLFDTDVKIGLMSYKEELVESKSPDSLFWKIDFLLDHLPVWMKPAKKDYDDTHLSMVNKRNGNVITGQSTTKRSSRAGRYSWLGMDECDWFDEFSDVWATSVAATDTRIGISSVGGTNGPAFYRLALSDELPPAERPVRLDIRWFHHPMHDDAWFANEKTRYPNVAKFRNEVLMDPFGDDSLFVYPQARDKRVDATVTYNRLLPQYTSIDPGVRDDCGSVFIQEDPREGWVDVLDAYVAAGKPADYYGSVFTGLFESGQWDYDEWALRLMPWMEARHAQGVTFYGDVAGWNREAATADSFYSRLTKYKIFVRRDRLKDGMVAQSRLEARSFRGRREALMELMPRLRFADTQGAAFVLEALRQHRYQDQGDKAVASEQQKPLHDWTSHVVSALEYFAVNKMIERKMHQVYLTRAPKPSRLKQVKGIDNYARWNARRAS
jgi:hypothetical protein